MASDLHELMGAVVFESGSRLTDQDALRFLAESVRTFNTRAPEAIVLSKAPGATQAFVLNRDIPAIEERILILLATLMWLDGASRDASFDAIKRSNAAGTTSLDGIEFALSKRAKDIRTVLDGPDGKPSMGLWSELDGAGVLTGAGHSELGETLDITGGGDTAWSDYTRWGP